VVVSPLNPGEFSGVSCDDGRGARKSQVREVIYKRPSTQRSAFWWLYLTKTNTHPLFKIHICKHEGVLV
jgi:hypothetical protein